MERLKLLGKFIIKVLRTAFKVVAYALTGLVVTAVLAAIIGLFLLYTKGAFAEPDWSLLNDRREISVFLDENGTRMREICEFCRKIIPLSEMGKFPEIAIAVEDKNFETRLMPYDMKRLLIAIWHNLSAGSTVQGSSTLTMQVARNVFLEKELKEQWAAETPWDEFRAKWWRKLREAYVAARLEYYLGRSQRMRILETYLNTANCGGNVYGVEACSRHLLNKNAKDLTTAEYALIAGFWRRPRLADLTENKKNDALALRSRVLQQMVETEKITDEGKNTAEREPLPESPRKKEKDPCRAMHATELARLEVVKHARVSDGGLEINTTINCDYQLVAVEELKRILGAMKERNPAIAQDLWGVALALDARNGDIKVFAQDPDFSENEYRADQIQRHAGSGGKPFGMLAALIKGLRLTCKDEGNGRCKLIDTPGLSIPVKKNGKLERKYFHNFPRVGLARYVGSAEPIRCMAESLNTCFLSLIKGIRGSLGFLHKDDVTETLIRMKVALPKLANDNDILSEALASRLGIDRKLHDPGHTAIIGSFDISPWEMGRAWSGFFGGEMVEPRIVSSVRDDLGEIDADFSTKFYGDTIASMWIESEKEKLRLEETNRLWHQDQQRLAEAKAQRKRYAAKSRRTIYLSLLKSMKFDEASLAASAQVESEKISHSLVRSLRAVVEFDHGTAKLARTGKWDKETQQWTVPKLDFQLACKTGTATDDEGKTTDNWITCRTVSHVVVVWIGRKTKLPMETDYIDPRTGQRYQETGGGNAGPIAVKILHKMYETYPKEEFPENTNPFKPFKTPVAQEPVKNSEEVTEEIDSSHGY